MGDQPLQAPDRLGEAHDRADRFHRTVLAPVGGIDEKGEFPGAVDHGMDADQAGRRQPPQDEPGAGGGRVGRQQGGQPLGLVAVSKRLAVQLDGGRPRQQRE